MPLRNILLLSLLHLLPAFQASAVELSIATFNVDATPPVGAPLCIGTRGPVVDVTDPLSARGIILLPADQLPVVLCAVDWVGIANGGNTAWREALAKAAKTTPDRVAVHALHQHDAPYCGFTTEDILQEHELGGAAFDPDFARVVIERAAKAVARAAANPIPVTHIAAGEAVVKRIASNRRILGEDGKVRAVRFTATRNPKLRAEPVGTIDPFLKSVSFWANDTPLAVLTYYATHPQSHYGKGHVTADFVGHARNAREAALGGVPHIHFNGAGGNLGAGKWNDGSAENRPVLAGRLEAGMKSAWEKGKKVPVTDAPFQWSVEPVVLPMRNDVDDSVVASRLLDTNEKLRPRIRMAREIAFRERVRKGIPIEISRLRIGNIQLIHLPGELFVEYQLAAQDMALDSFVCMAAYGDYGPGYIGTAISYEEGGYETKKYISRTAPAVEEVLMAAMEKLLR
ncbi:MAG: hypothetical protein L3K26_00535 [Candidatus Hydrogenedentes bacterium]|nr:hypothetical protein [Candidatus Hydrogenedentota bacterium]